MKTPEEWAKFEWENAMMKTEDFIKEIQKDAYNQAIEDVSNTSISSRKIHEAEINNDDWDEDSLWCNRNEILKLKIK